MKNNSVDKDFDECVSNAHLASSGWGMDCFNHSNPFESHAFYVIDYRFSTVNLLTVSKGDFNRVTPPDNVTTGILAGCVAEAMSQFKKDGSNPDKDERIAPSLIAYIKKTETYRVWKRTSKEGERLHIVLNIYNAATNDAVVRPVIVKSEKSYLTVDEVTSLSKQVEGVDRKTHPEWFV